MRHCVLHKYYFLSCFEPWSLMNSWCLSVHRGISTAVASLKLTNICCNVFHHRNARCNYYCTLKSICPKKFFWSYPSKYAVLSSGMSEMPTYALEDKRHPVCNNMHRSFLQLFLFEDGWNLTSARNASQQLPAIFESRNSLKYLRFQCNLYNLCLAGLDQVGFEALVVLHCAWLCC